METNEKTRNAEKPQINALGEVFPTENENLPLALLNIKLQKLQQADAFSKHIITILQDKRRQDGHPYFSTIVS